jgi:hypothetical protein
MRTWGLPLVLAAALLALCGGGWLALRRGFSARECPPTLVTQSISDGQIFWIIKNGVRLTGMPAWGADTKEDDRSSNENGSTKALGSSAGHQ